MDDWVLTASDIRVLLDVLDGCRTAAAADDIFYASVLTGLRELIPCDDLTFQLMDVAEQRVRALFVTDDGVHRQESIGMIDEGTTAFWQQFWEEDGCAGPLRTGDYSTLLHHAEVTRTRAFANSALGSLYGEIGLQDEIVVPMTPLDGTDRRLVLWRSKDLPDFSEREQAMLTLIRPHIADLHTRRCRELRGQPDLTPRQWEVLRQVAMGASTTQIARRTGLCDSTVRKHLENAYFRLGVHSRTEALARVHAFLALPAPRGGLSPPVIRSIRVGSSEM